jgi:hypothetical protein
MLDNQPMVKVFTDGATVRLLLDTGAEATVLTPAAAPRIGAQHARVNKGEASNSVRRTVFFHHQGEIRDRPNQQARHPNNQIVG